MTKHHEFIIMIISTYNNTNACHTAKDLLFCYNCYQSRHIAKNCPLPVVSFGIVCYDPQYDTVKYLMVERKYSIAFVEFLMGKYYICDGEYIQKLFNRMTLFERCCIGKYEFKILWKRLWNMNGYHKKSLQREFWKASIKFYILKNGFICSQTQRHLQIQLFIENSDQNYKTPEWYFPKGKRVHEHEEPQDCAIREFKEETNISHIDIEVKNATNLFEEEHIAGNGKIYKVYFFIAKYTGGQNSHFLPQYIHKQNRDFIQKNSEIGDMDWFTYDECIAKFRPYETEKLNLLNVIHTHILS